MLAAAALCFLLHAEDWPMLAHDAARSGASADQLKPPFARKWYRMFPDEGIQSGVQPVIADGVVYIGTLRGILHAIDAESGKDRWTFQAGRPILHSAAAASERVIFGAADGIVYAVNAKDGSVAWKVQTESAVWNAPACADGVAYIGSRDGNLYAIDIASGQQRWKGACGAPLFNSPAIDLKNSRVLIGAEDMIVRAFALTNGRPLWTSPKLQGCSLRGYHPVIAPNGDVLVTSQPVAGYDRFQDLLWEMSRAVFGDISSWRIKSKEEKQQWKEKNFAQLAQPETFGREMDWLRERLEKEPGFQTFFVLDGKTGEISSRPPIVASESMNGPGAPALLTRDSKVIVKFQAVLRSRYEHYSPFLNPGWLDAATGALTPLMSQDRTYGWHDSLLLVHDEQSQLSLAGNLLLNTHQDNVNALDLSTLRGNPSPLAVNIHEPQPGQAAGIRIAAWQGKELEPGSEWFARGSAVYGGGSVLDVPVAIAGDSFYFLPTHEINSGCALIAYKMQANAPAPQPQERKKFPLKVELSAEDWKRLQDEPWDWDTLAGPRIKSFMDAMPGPVPGSIAAPLWDDADKALAAIPDSALDAIIDTPAFDPAKIAKPIDQKLQAQLSNAITEFLSTKWRPFQFPAGKAPQQAWVFFTDPAQTLTTLMFARPFVDDVLRAKIDSAAAELQSLPREFSRDEGRPRERYDVPTKLMHFADEPRIDDLGRIYPLWLWSRVPQGAEWVKSQWPSCRGRIRVSGKNPESDLGNARIAGLIAFCRLAKEFGDNAAADEARTLARQAMRERLRYEFAHTRGGVFRMINGQRSVAARWRNLTPDVGALLAKFAQPISGKLISNYVDKLRPGWWLAWNVEQNWANEVPFQLPSTPYEFFSAKAMILNEQREKLAVFIDQPWCAGDEYFIRKLALALMRDSNP